MKIFQGVSLLIGITCIAGTETTDYPVAGIDPDSEKFARIYEECAAAELAAPGVPRKCTITRHIGGGIYEVGLQVIPAQFTNVVYEPQPGAIDLGEEKRWADGEVVGTFHVRETGGVVEHVGRTLRVYVRRDVAAKMLVGEFVARLKAGEEFLLHRPAKEERCQACAGSGKVSVGAPPCKACGGSGKTLTRVRIRIHWGAGE